jgi:hypothetical protein
VNTADGTIGAWSYLGTAYHLLVDTADFGRIALTVPSWRHGAPPEVGETIRIGWDADASIPVEDD